ncbi:MAG: LysM peptidoglycan-binding domain-containing protein [Treponema sp.]|jgi:murein DD-endopeptidase MepM/ murein hydrolase activator NlpD|nr:LysM peptidoglycan-binding domain-containing protein [Treponema sp.]
MNVRYGLLYLLLFALSFACFGQNQTHVVRQGETITSIARSYGVDANRLMSVNNITDPQRLQVGKQLVIPSVASIEHRAVRGETLYGIARQYGIDIKTLRSVNNLSETYVLKAGDVLRIPHEGATVSSTSLWPIAAKEVAYRNGNLGGVILIGEPSEVVKSITTGTVISAGPYHGFGQVVVVKTAGGYSYVYGGCDSLLVKTGDTVRHGTELGRLGVDATSGKPQLSLMVFLRNNPVDPATAPRA